MGTTDTNDAAGRLRLLQTEFLRLPDTGPEITGRTGTRTHPPAPLNLTVIDHITDSVREVHDRALIDNPAAGPLPADPARAYDWWRASTPDLEGERQLAREMVIYRQGLEHAIQAGDTKVVCKHPCPSCGCWGLFWRHAERRAVCAYSECVTEDGLATMWELKHLAYEHVTRQKMLKATAT